MTAPVWYSTRWNDLTRQPIEGYEWVDAPQARTFYTRHEFFDIVDAEAIQDDLPFPRWVISPSYGFRIRFFDQALSVVRVVDYDPVEGRLFRSMVVDYTYPDDQQRWMEDQADAGCQIRIKPDGTGSIETWHGDSGEETRKEFTGLDTTSLWLPVPEFGDWSALTDPDPAASELAEWVGAS